MRGVLRRAWWTAAVGSLAAACQGTETTGSLTTGGAQLEGTAALVSRALREELLDNEEAYADAAQRLMLAVMTGSAEGVELTTNGSSQFGTVGADLDQDGSFETPLSVTLLYESPSPSLASPFTVTVGSGQPGGTTMSVGFHTQIDETTGDIVGDAGFGSLETDYAILYFKEGDFTRSPEPEAGQVLGTMGFDASNADYEDPISGTTSLEIVTVGTAFRVRVTVNDDPTTPEDEHVEFVLE